MFQAQKQPQRQSGNLGSGPTELGPNPGVVQLIKSAEVPVWVDSCQIDYLAPLIVPASIVSPRVCHRVVDDDNVVYRLVGETRFRVFRRPRGTWEYSSACEPEGDYDLCQAIERFGRGLGLSLRVSSSGLTFFKTDEVGTKEEPFASAIYKLSAAILRERTTALVNEGSSRIARTKDQIKVERGELYITSKAELVLALSALGGLSPRTGTAVSPLSHTVGELEDTGQLRLASLVDYEERRHGRVATTDSVERFANELLVTPGEPLNVPFNTGGSLCDGTYAILTSCSEKLRFPARLIFGGGGLGEHHLDRIVRDTGQLRCVSEVKVALELQTIDPLSSIALLDFNRLAQAGLRQISDGRYLEFHFDHDNYPARINLVYDRGLGEVRPNVVALKAPSTANSTFRPRVGIIVKFKGQTLDPSLSDQEIIRNVDDIVDGLVTKMNGG